MSVLKPDSVRAALHHDSMSTQRGHPPSRLQPYELLGVCRQAVQRELEFDQVIGVRIVDGLE